MSESEIKANILAVDDTPDNLRLLSAILTQQGYHVRKALNGQRAIASAREFPPDLILLDVMMPELNGYQVCQHLKSLPETREIPVIFLSALDNVSDKVKAFEAGGVDYIMKPFQEKEVVVRVANHLTMRHQQKLLIKQNERLQKEIREREQVESALQLAKEQSERLLLNIFPQAIVEKLKTTEGPIAEKFTSATVLFADLVGFTELATRISPLELVSLLNRIFSEFDKLTQKYRLEKIKTIGDAYMVAGGLPLPRENHAEAIADLALEMQKAIAVFPIEQGESFQLRIGIHTGDVVAGTIGTKKNIYDLWGDTVNVASRMESQGLPGRIQVTSAVWELLEDRYLLEERGAIAVKGKGEMTTYWLMGKNTTD